MSFSLAQFFGLEAKKPNVPAVPQIESYIPQQATDIQNQMYSLGQSYLSPAYEQSMYNRMKDLMSPEFDRQMEEQQQGIVSSGIEGTASTALLGKLRKDYLNDLMGKSFDVAQTGKQYGASLLDTIRQSLQGQGTANYNAALNNRNMVMGLDANAQAQTASNMASLGSLLGSAVTAAMPTPTSSFNFGSIGGSGAGSATKSQLMGDFNSSLKSTTGSSAMWDSFLRGGK